MKSSRLGPARDWSLIAYGALLVIAVLLVGRLAWLQHGANAALRTRQASWQRLRTIDMPAARGTIVDCNGELLAYDRLVLDVRAEATARLPRTDAGQAFERWADDLAGDLAVALSAEDASELDQRRATLRARIAHHPPSASELADGDGSGDVLHRVDFLVDRGVDSQRVVDALLALQRPGRLFLHVERRFVRTYPSRDSTYGPVGLVGERRLADGSGAEVLRGMESLAGLQPGEPGEREVWQDSVQRRYWSEVGTAPSKTVVLQTTLDLTLQQAAHEELQRAVDAVNEHYGSPPEWAALCLADVESGGMLAMASFRDGSHPAAAAFSPTQCLCPPGSVVKPLVFSVALERGVLDWEHDQVDCRPDGSRGWQVPHVSRWIKDSHTCGVLAPHDIIVQSSNIGAAKVGLRLGREGLVEYLRRFRFGERTQTGLPGELDGLLRLGSEPAGDDPSDPRGLHRLLAMPERLFWGYTAPSLSIGYDYNVTPLQVLRAYLSLLSRRPRDLHLYRQIVVDGHIEPAPHDQPPAETLISEANLERLRGAMMDVVSDEPEATGRILHKELHDAGVPDGVIAGKTGTSEYEERRAVDGVTKSVTVRTASFAGFAPAMSPRFVVICVVQKPGASAFWGGRYAAPAAGRLLLAALGHPGPRQAADSQVSASSGVEASSRAEPGAGW